MKNWLQAEIVYFEKLEKFLSKRNEQLTKKEKLQIVAITHIESI